MRDQADAWLGFEPAELRRFARAASLEDVRVTKIPASLCGDGPDKHLPWQVMTAHKSESHGTPSISEGTVTRHTKGRHGHG
jgi:hypothetical protein